MRHLTTALLVILVPTRLATSVLEGPLNLERDGAFGFPQAEAKVLCNTDALRVSAWNDAGHLFLQALIWHDDSATPGETDDGRAIGDWSELALDLDADGKRTANVDRSYSLNPLPSMPGLHYSVQLGEGFNSGLKSDAAGRGSIRYVDAGAKGHVRVDSLVILLKELGRKPGEIIRLAYWASSPMPKIVVNSVGFERDTPYYEHHLPREKYHELTLADRPAQLDLARVPEGREETVPAGAKALGPMPEIGSVPPELTATEWINVDRPPTLESLRGSVLVVEFWATWCGPCVKGIPHLNELHAKHASAGLRIVSFTNQSRRGIERFLETTPVHYPMGTGSDLGQAFGVSAIPQAFVIGRDGRVRWRGHPESSGFDEAIEEALRTREPPAGGGG